MPAVSTSQQGAAGLALSAKKGEVSPDKLKGAAKELYESMSKEDLEKFAGTGHAGLPRHVKGRPTRIRRARSA